MTGQIIKVTGFDSLKYAEKTLYSPFPPKKMRGRFRMIHFELKNAGSVPNDPL